MGPLKGLKVVELAGIGPAPFCCMMLADMGAEILRIDRLAPADLGNPVAPKDNPTLRGRRSVAVDLKSKDGIEAVKRLVAKADVLIEGFRPGVTERLGLGPDVCHAVNPRLVYGRMTGWGQSGPLAHVAGHDINYIAIAGALGMIGPRGGAPVPPLNVVGDFGGGALYLAVGVLAALFERMTSGKGQVVDAAMVDGVASLLTSAYGSLARGDWSQGRGGNGADGSAPWYAVYETKDGKHVSIGSIERRFYAELLEKLGLDDDDLRDAPDRQGWDDLRDKLAQVFKTKTQDEWTALLQDTDICYAPVLDLDEVEGHPQIRARETLVDLDGVVQPAPAPRFSRTPSAIQSPPAAPGEHTDAALADWGFDKGLIDELKTKGAIR